MGLFNFSKKNKNENITQAVTNMPVQQPINNQAPILNLQKGGILNLTKTEPTLQRMRVSAGWDVAGFGRNYDLDLCAMLLDENMKLIGGSQNCVYYGSKHANGIFLDGDNLTGEGDGDDENIHVILTELNKKVCHIVFCVVIYDGSARKQSFSHVRNAYVRLVDEKNGAEREVCRYNLSSDGGDNTAIQFAALDKDGDEWSFRAIGDFVKASIADIKRAYQ